MTATKSTESTNTCSPELSRRWTHWLKQHLHDDSTGSYFAFTLTNRYWYETLKAKFESRCREHKGTFVFLMPAVSARGHKHYHGLIRIPSSARSMPTTVTIAENGWSKRIMVPWTLASLLWNSGTKNPHSTFGNLHLRNNGFSVVPLRFRSDAAESAINYWTKTLDHELRDFSEGEFIPHHVRASIKVRTGRDPHPRKETVQ